MKKDLNKENSLERKKS